MATLALAIGCAALEPAVIPQGIDQDGASTARAVQVSVSDSDVCSPFRTPLPTPTPGAPVLARAANLGTPQFPPQSGSSKLLVDRFYSNSVEKEMPVAVYLPPGYFESDRYYPTLYMLGGFHGDHLEWVNYGLCEAMESLVRNGHIQPMIVVMPAGERSWWFNHAKVPDSDGKAWGDYIWKDVVNHVDAKYRTLRQPASRAIGGLSAGGQGAFMFGLTHPEVFRVIGAHSLSLRHADGSLAIFGDENYFNQYDPLWLLRNVTTWKDLVFWIDVGRDDDQWGQSVHEFSDLLTQLGIPHEFQDTWPGIHDGYYWGAHIEDYMIWYSSHLVGQ